MGIASHEDLDVRQVATTLAEPCYALSRELPKDELFGLVSQIRRASVSIPANFAEGFGRDQTCGFIKVLRVAMGSSRELDTHLVLIVRLGLVDVPRVLPCRELNTRVSKMLRSLIRRLVVKRDTT